MKTILDSWLEDIPQQFRSKKNIGVLIRAFARQMDELQVVFDDLRTKRDIDTAEGKNLDRVGDIVVLTRKDATEILRQRSDEALSDENYRKALHYKLMKNTSECTYDDIMQSIFTIWNVDKIKYYEDPAYPARINLRLETSDIDAKDPAIGRVFPLKSAGVAILYIIMYVLYVHFEALNHVYLSKVTFGMKFPYWQVNYLDGSWPLDGSVRLNGLTISMPVDTKIMLKIQGMGDATMAAVPVMVVRAMLDKDLIPMTKPKLSLGFKFPYYYGMHYLDGSWPLNGKVSLKGLTILMPVKMTVGIGVHGMDESDIKVEVTSRRDVWYLDGTNPLDGTKMLDALNEKEEL